MGNSGLQPGDVDEYGKRPGGDASCRFIKCSSTCPNPTTNWPDKPADRAPSVRPAICGYASEKRKLLITPHVAKRNVGHRTAKQTSPIFHFSFFIFHFSFFIFHFSFFIFHPSSPISHFSFLIFHFSSLIPHFSFLIFHFSFFEQRTGKLAAFHPLPTPNFASGNAPQRVVETPVGRTDS